MEKGVSLTVSIIGLGLMGGSFALALKSAKIADKIVGFDASDTNAKEALNLSLVDELVGFEALTQSDILVLAIPVETCVSVLSNITLQNPNITIIDLGSTKEKISRNCPQNIRPNLVAAHPMTGTEYSGPSAAMADLYAGKTVVLCDLELSGSAHINTARMVFDKFGMSVVEMDSAVHDLHASFISHLPHLLSFSLANTVMGQEDPKDILALAAGGFKDMSRLAKSSPDMWKEIFAQNRKNIIGGIGSFKKELAKFEDALESCDENALFELMKNANCLYGVFK